MRVLLMLVVLILWRHVLAYGLLVTLRYGAVFVRDEDCFEIENLFSQG
jgi:hypothetical protein